jgi:hypothetical protein
MAVFGSLEELKTAITDTIYQNNAGLITAEVLQERMIDIIDTFDAIGVGAQGPPGIQGIQGIQGYGEKGDNGEKGDQGIPGSINVSSGTAAPTGGADGDVYFQYV